MKNIGYFFGWINILPVNILAWLFFFLPEYIKGTFENIEFHSKGIIRWDIDNNSKFYKKMVKDTWWGFVIGSNVVFIDYRPEQNPEDITYIRHETAHVLQNYIFGVLFYPAYILASLYIYLFLKNKHTYLDNPFERWARRRAGQKVNISRDEWPDQDDRVPWG